MADIDKDIEWLHNIDFGVSIDDLNFDDIELNDLDTNDQNSNDVEIKYDGTENYIVLDKKVINDNFKKWWKNSYCCNSKGEPIVVYHSTNAEFDTFTSDLDGTANGRPVYGGGFCFSAYESYTKDFGKNVMPCVLSIQRPLDLQLGQQLDLKITYQLLYKDKWEKYYNDPDHTERGYLKDKCSYVTSCFQMLNNEGYTFKQIMNAYGYDGIIDGHIFVVVEPNQIKSISNNGNWSTQSDNIFESKENVMNIPKLLEKLKKIIIEPQEKILFDDMEDETGMNTVDECEGGSASLGTAPTPSFAQVKVNGKPVPGKSSKKKKIEESKTICKIIKSFKDSEGEIHNDVLFEGSKDDCLKYASNNNLKTSLYNSRKLGRRPQYFIREFDVYSYDRPDKSSLKRNQAIIANSMIEESLKIAISEIDALYEDFNNNNIDEVVISWLDKYDFKNVKSEKGFVYKNESGNYIHYIIFNKPNSITYQIKNKVNETLFKETWQVSDIEDAEDLFNNTITKKFESFE